MEIVKFVYLDQEVEFEVSKNNVLVNATEMAKIFGKEIKHFNENESTKRFIKSCLKRSENVRIKHQEFELKSRNSDFSEYQKLKFSPFLSIEKESDLIVSVQKSGTWMHRILALKFAAWLDSDFEVWIYETIDALINQYFKEEMESLIEKLSAKKKKEIKREDILKKYADFPEIAEYFELDKQEKDAAKKHQSAVRSQIKQLKFEFNF